MWSFRLFGDLDLKVKIKFKRGVGCERDDSLINFMLGLFWVLVYLGFWI